MSTFNFAEGRVETGINVYAPEGTQISTDYGVLTIGADAFYAKLGTTVASTILAAIGFLVILLVVCFAAKYCYDADSKAESRRGADYVLLAQGEPTDGEIQRNNSSL